MPAQPLSAVEREQIRVGIQRGDTDAVIAVGVGRHRCTINVEINRNGGRGAYSAVAAEDRAMRCRARPKQSKLVADSRLAAHVARRLAAKDSPMTISIELARGVNGVVASISHETIYQAIYDPARGLPAGCHKGLHLKRRHRKHRNLAPPASTHSLGEFNLITTRPAVAAERVEVGHLEGDLIVGAYNRSALITVFDRTSRHLWLAKPLAGKRAHSVHDAAITLLKRIPPELRRSLTSSRVVPHFTSEYHRANGI